MILKNVATFFFSREKTTTTTTQVYLGSIPPYMKPGKIRSIFSQYDTIHRIYLVPEDKAVYERRRKNGGNKKPKFVEGWIEFDSKKVAKRVARTLNNTRVGSKKHTFYYDDLWNIKYLSKFKWNHLTEKLVYEKRVQQKRLEAEISQAKREDEYYLKRVDEAKAIQSMEKRRRDRMENAEDEETRKFEEERIKKTKRVRRTFYQRKIAAAGNTDSTGKGNTNDDAIL